MYKNDPDSSEVSPIRQNYKSQKSIILMKKIDKVLSIQGEFGVRIFI